MEKGRKGGQKREEERGWGELGRERNTNEQSSGTGAILLLQTHPYINSEIGGGSRSVRAMA